MAAAPVQLQTPGALPPPPPPKREPREELLRLPQTSPTKTGLRKRGQTSSILQVKSDSASTLDQIDGLLQPHYARSVVSMRSEMTLGILDYYLNDAGVERNDSDPILIDPAMQTFDFDLTPEKNRIIRISDEDDRAVLPSYRTNFFRKALPKLTTPPKRRLQLSRRTSDLSICCQGEDVLDTFVPVVQDFRKASNATMPELSSSCPTIDSSPISPRNIIDLHREELTPTRNRCDSVASPSSTSRGSRCLENTPPVRDRNGSLLSNMASSTTSQQCDTQPGASTSSSSFEFVRSLRRRPLPLRERPPSLKLHHGGVKQFGLAVKVRLRRLFSFRRSKKG